MALVLGAGVVVFAQLRGGRNIWIIALVAMFVSWFSILLSGIFPPSVLPLSMLEIYEPFQFRLELILNQNNWQTILTLMSVLLAYLLLELGKRDVKVSSNLAFILIYSASALGAVLAGNVQTILLTWTITDLIFIVKANSFKIKDSSSQNVFADLSIVAMRCMPILILIIANQGFFKVKGGLRN